VSGITVVRAAHLLDPEAGQLRDDVGLVVEGRRIVRIERSDAPPPPGAHVIDLGAATLMPGLVDAHLHFWGANCSQWQDFFFNTDGYRALWSARDARELLHAGFTSVRCCGGFVGADVARAIEEGLIEGPRVVAAGQFIIQRGGTWDPRGVPESEIVRRDFYADGVDEMRRIVRRRVRGGARLIKLGLSSGQAGDLMPGWGDDPHRQRANFTLPEVRAAVEEARFAGVKVAVHAIGEAAVTLALDAGVATIEHAHGISDDTRKRLADAQTIVNATLSAQKSWIDHGPEHGLPAALIECSRRHFHEQIRAFARSLDLGVNYALGSDSIGPPLSPHRGNVGEYLLAVDHGMTPAQALRAGLVVGAAALGAENDLGRLSEGRVADVIAVDGDPLKDISVLRGVRFVMKDGIVHRCDAAPSPR
jgi:imidazolonepropionase-like amidohydrolase